MYYGSMSRDRGIRVFSFAAILSALLASCNVPDPFSLNQQDPGFNWIADYGFDALGGTGTTGWAMAYAGDSGDDFDYMSLEDTGQSVGDGTTGLSPSEAVYRLSIRNLFPNGSLDDDGSSWAEAPGSVNARWAPGSVTAITDPAVAILDATDPRSIHGQSLWFNRESSSQYLGLLLSGCLFNSPDSTTGPAAGSLYQIRFLFRPDGDGTLTLSHAFGSAPPPLGNARFPFIPSDGDISLSSCAFEDTSLPYSLFFGSDGTQRASLDDIRVARLGMDLSLSLALTNAAGRERDPEGGFIPGLYSFRVWVKDDPEAGELLTEGLSATGLSRARAVTLEFRAEGASEGGGSQLFTRPAGGWTAWTPLELELSTMTLDPVSTDPVFSLRICPADRFGSDSLEPGSILIAAPQLNFILRN